MIPMRVAARPWVIVALLLAGGLVSAQSPKLDISEKALTSAAVRYVAEYEKQFAFLIADEEYTQMVFDADGRRAQTRVLKAEMFLTYLPADGEWMAVRDVIEVDGEAVKNREDLRALLAKREELRLVKQLTWRNSRYNLGRVERNFNEPTLPLLLLDSKRKSRVKFDRKHVSRDEDVTLATLAFEEQEAPTLVATRNEGAVRAKGEFLLDAATGTIRRTVFQLTRPGIDARLVTSYKKDDKLNLWLPSVFTERYESSSSAGGGFRLPNSASRASRELVECVAKYSNYRRFEVTARIK
jgi:hypothetical protein